MANSIIRGCKYDSTRSIFSFNMWFHKKVSVIFPAYNEQENINEAVGDFLGTGIVDELIVVDNNSRDKTAKLARSAGAKVVTEKNQGYGFALQRGLKETNGDLCILAEPDGTFRGMDIIKLLLYSDKFDLVLGTRTKKELINKGANMGIILRFGNILIAKFMQFLFDMPSLSDCGCTLRVVNRKLLRKIGSKLTVGGSYFLPEMVILSKLSGAKIIEIPVNYQKRKGESKITGSFKRALIVGFRMVLLIIAYKARNRPTLFS